jgi:glucose/arabinose dehydrogenase
MTIRRFVAAVSVVFACSVQPALAQLRADLFSGGLSLPVAFVQDPAQPNVQVVVQQAGRVRVIQNGVLLDDDFLNLTSHVLSGGEQGLLGLAFSPDYATSGRIYVNFTNLSGDTVIARFMRDATNALRADPATRFDLVWPGGLPYIDQPFANHNGGNLMFGPDGYLYIGLGDGGSGNDPFHLAQNPGSLLGKMLRIDVSVGAAHPTGYSVPPTNPFVSQPGVLPEIWAFGLRNPWRYSFDDPAQGGTGALVIGDVGQGAWEEVDYEPAGQGGRNYGWRNREGAHDNVLDLPPFFLPLRDPIHEYPRDVGHSITGGFVYRGNALGAGYTGRYFFADIITNRVWSLGLSIDPGTGQATAASVTEHTAELGNGATSVSSFGVDASGELYLVSYGRGEIYRIAFDGATPPPPSPSSCTTVQPGPDWTCANGNWYPPGYPIPEGPPPPPPPPPPGPPPPPPPSFCPTVQPGPDWTCVNGNWYPPGYPIPETPPPPPPPPPAPPSDPPPPSSSCTTVQPGPDWICFNGNWLPPGITGSCNTVMLEPRAGGSPITSVTVAAAGGPAEIWTLADPSFACPWSALSEVSWITVTFPAFPTIHHGDGSVQFTVEPNTSGVERIGRIRVAEKFLTVIQSGG